VSEGTIVVAVDGPAASGKSTVSKALAKKLGFIYVDSGAMYRAATWKALEDGIDVNDSDAVIALLHRMEIGFELVDGQVHLRINGVNPAGAIRNPSVTEKVSVVAAIPEVRRILVEHQRSLTKYGNLVMEGRDIGSVVFPDAAHKFYLDAPTDVRASRRKQDLEAMNIRQTNEGVAEAIQKRDHRDSARNTAPLQIALGAVVIDNSKISVAETVDIIVEHIHRQPTRRGSFTVGSP